MAFPTLDPAHPRPGARIPIPRLAALLLVTLFLVPLLPGRTQAYDFGVVPQFEARRLEAIWTPILEEVSRRSGVPLGLRIAPAIPEFEKTFSVGDYDFAYMNPFHLVMANRQQGYVPLVRDRGSMLQGIIVVRKDSPIQSVPELDGQVVAFPAPNALGAALIPRAEFARKYKIAIRPLYVKSHTSVYLNVALDQAVAGGGVQQTLEQQTPELQNLLRILYRTDEFPPHPVAVHPRVPPEAAEAVRRAFLALGDDPRGRFLLRQVPIQAIGQADLADYDALRDMGLETFYVAK